MSGIHWHCCMKRNARGDEVAIHPYKRVPVWEIVVAGVAEGDGRMMDAVAVAVADIAWEGMV